MLNMADDKKAFGDLFKLVKLEEPKDEKERKRICSIARIAFESVKNGININKKNYINIIGDVIRNVEEEQFQLAFEKIQTAEMAYKNHVLKHLEEEERVSAKQKEHKADNSRLPTTPTVRPGPTGLDTRSEWTRTDVVKKFEQMFDVEWKLAYEESQHIREDMLCEDLYGIIKDEYRRSKDIIVDAIATMNKTFKQIVQQSQAHTEDTTDPNNDTRTLLLLFIRQNFDKIHDRLQEQTRHFMHKYTNRPKTVHFAECCATVTLWMCAQDPPMSLAYVDKGQHCQSETYTCHGPHAGDRIQYRVMPALLTETNGTVLVKGKMACGK